MKVLVLYDSVYGNTEKVAKAIGSVIGGDVRVLRLGEVGPSDLASLDLLVVGSPTQGGRATPAIQEFLDRVPESAVKGINVAAFDTRFQTKLVKIFGYAAGRVANNFEDKGGRLVAPPEGFIVKGKEGPLKDGELERAAGWAKGILEKKK